jgi:hypothetical protein
MTGDASVTGPLPGGVPVVLCPACRRPVPAGEFCGGCGAHLADDPPTRRRHPRHRPHAYAASPNEHVLSLRLISTLLPHLPRRRSALFRGAFATTTAVLLVAGLARLTGPGVLLAATAVPVLYLLYLYEVEVYESSPLLVLGPTFGLGLVLGAGFAELTGKEVTGAVITETLRGVQARDLFVKGILLPLIAQALMLAGVLLLRLSRRFDEALDGFAFGVAGALAFVLASTLVNLWPELSQGLVSDRQVTDTATEIIQRGLLIPVVYATGTGLIGASLWLRRGRTRDPQWRHTGLAATLAVVLAADLGLGVLAVLESRPAVVITVTAAVACALLLRARVALHTMLMAEVAADVPIGEAVPCTHCHHLVPRMAFCAYCGIATRATPKSGSGRLDRKVR